MRSFSLLLIMLLMTTMAVAQSPDRVVRQDERFTLYQSRVVRDAKTNLEWWPAPDIDVSWHDATRWTQYAAQFNGGWRLPTIQELETLYEAGNGEHNLNSMFQISAYTVWAKKQKGNRSAWCFSFDTGQASWAARHRSPMKRVMAVRTVKLPPQKENNQP
ncbi:MAG: DUF1566 domain-containing protein [Desulfatibacillum sp.]|nr:DUF1566 domain-containing protein [Desulfatibacillum sp.]